MLHHPQPKPAPLPRLFRGSHACLGAFCHSLGGSNGLCTPMPDERFTAAIREATMSLVCPAQTFQQAALTRLFYLWSHHPS